MGKKFRPLLALSLAFALILSGCGEEEPAPPTKTPFAVTAAVSDSMAALDPAAAGEGSETVLYHLYENLLTWADDGSGRAALVPGQAERYTVETDYAGNATYTFTLRENSIWSDGKPVTASDFVFAWQRLANPRQALPHRALLSALTGYEQAPSTEAGEAAAEEGAEEDAPPEETGAPSEEALWSPEKLGVSAPDSRTLVVTLTGNPGWFLEAVCAGAYTVPLRADLVESKSFGSVTNGAYVLSEAGGAQVVLERSMTYYKNSPLSPETLTFLSSQGSEADYRAYTEGELDLVYDLPETALTPAGEGAVLWRRTEKTSVTALLCNTLAAPLDEPEIRRALALAIDTQALIEAVGDPTLAPAVGIVPSGVSDYGPTAQPEDGASPICRDFRIHSHELVTVREEENEFGEYQRACQEARRLLSQADHPDSATFPTLTLLYEKGEAAGAVAQYLQSTWKTVLGISISPRECSREELLAALAGHSGEGGEEDGAQAPSCHLILTEISAGREDAMAFLSSWYSENPDNRTGYRSEAYDILISSAQAAMDLAARDAYLHDAEAILLAEVPVIPLYYGGGSLLLREGYEGLYCRANGVYFLSGLRRSTADGTG